MRILDRRKEAGVLNQEDGAGHEVCVRSDTDIAQTSKLMWMGFMRCGDLLEPTSNFELPGFETRQEIKARGFSWRWGRKHGRMIFDWDYSFLVCQEISEG